MCECPTHDAFTLPNSDVLSSVIRPKIPTSFAEDPLAFR